jgi:3',5'-nucleoside bisphosphate phosphatase
MLIEMHSHTSEHSRCSRVPAVELVKQVFAKGLQGIVFTDHHYLWNNRELKEVRHASAVPDHFLIMTGQEVTTSGRGDVLVYGADEAIERGVTIEEIRARFPNAALVWAHPYRNGHLPEDASLLLPLLDGIEIFSTNHTVRENSKGLRDWHRLRFTAVSGTDTHGSGYAGLYPTQFDHPVATVLDIADEIVKGRCRPFLKEIPRSGASSRVTEVTIGAKGMDEIRERLVIRTIPGAYKWKTAERAFHIMEVISNHGFTGGPFRVPLPIDEDPESRTLIEQGMRGKLLYDKLLTASREDGRLYVRMTAQWLARLHSCRLRITPPDEFAKKETKRLDNYLERFTSISHPHTRKADEILSAIREEEAGRFNGTPDALVQGHGDFHPKNVLIGQDSQDNRETLFVAAIDFESSLCLPPAFDVGCFLAQFRNQFFPHKEILRDFPDDIFLDAYREASGRLDEGFSGQVELFRARTNMSIAAYLIKLGMGAGEDLWRVLVEAEHALSGL